VPSHLPELERFSWSESALARESDEWGGGGIPGFGLFVIVEGLLGALML